MTEFDRGFVHLLLRRQTKVGVQLREVANLPGYIGEHDVRLIVRCNHRIEFAHQFLDGLCSRLVGLRQRHGEHTQPLLHFRKRGRDYREFFVCCRGLAKRTTGIDEECAHAADVLGLTQCPLGCRIVIRDRPLYLLQSFINVDLRIDDDAQALLDSFDKACFRFVE